MFWNLGEKIMYVSEPLLQLWIFLDLYFIEFLGLLFLRNPISLKYFPVFHMLNVTFVLIYFQFGQIGCKILVILMGISLDLAVVFIFIKHIEIPSILNHNPERFIPT